MKSASSSYWRPSIAQWLWFTSSSRGPSLSARSARNDLTKHPDRVLSGRQRHTATASKTRPRDLSGPANASRDYSSIALSYILGW